MPEELPDLDTSEIGWIAYWNAFDAGAETLDVADVAGNYGSLYNFTLYDNGFDAEVDLEQQNMVDQTARVRVKADGWFIVWVTDSYSLDHEFYHQDVEIRSLCDIFGEFFINPNDTDGGSAPFIQPNRLAREIQRMVSNAGSLGVSAAAEDIGLYNYGYPDATEVITLAGWPEYSENTHSFIYENTEIVAAHAFGLSDDGYDDYFNDVSLTGSGNNNTIYAVDLVAEDLLNEPGEPNVWEQTWYSGSSGAYGALVLTFLVK